MVYTKANHWSEFISTPKGTYLAEILIIGNPGTQVPILSGWIYSIELREIQKITPIDMVQTVQYFPGSTTAYHKTDTDYNENNLVYTDGYRIEITYNK